jgi:hypothetical protein
MRLIIEARLADEDCDVGTAHRHIDISRRGGHFKYGGLEALI